MKPQTNMDTTERRCLNPFEFRAGLKLLAFWPAPKNRLNPFEFRAGLKLTFDSKAEARRYGLNPFEFRAGLKRKYMKAITACRS